MNGFLVVLAAALGLFLLRSNAQMPAASADPYANNPDAGKMQFPLAAPAGKDSGAINAAPTGAVNQGAARSGYLEVRAGL